MTNNLSDLFKVIQITRDQPQYGYNVAGIRKHDLSDLAQHHYLVTFIAWQLALHIGKEGGNINIQRTMEIAMVHDLGELFGGDISFYYAKQNQQARKHAKDFENENNLFLSNYFPDSAHYKDLIQEMEEQTTDESIVAKVADYTEVLFYKQRLREITKEDAPSNAQSLLKAIEKSTNKIVKDVLVSFIDSWKTELPGKTAYDIIAK